MAKNRVSAEEQREEKKRKRWVIIVTMIVILAQSGKIVPGKQLDYMELLPSAVGTTPEKAPSTVIDFNIIDDVLKEATTSTKLGTITV